MLTETKTVQLIALEDALDGISIHVGPLEVRMHPCSHGVHVGDGKDWCSLPLPSPLRPVFYEFASGATLYVGMNTHADNYIIIAEWDPWEYADTWAQPDWGALKPGSALTTTKGANREAKSGNKVLLLVGGC